MENLLWVILITVVPWIELRGSIPVGIGLGLNPWLVLFTVIIFNILIFFPIFFGLKFIYRFLSKWKFFEKTVERIRKKGEPYVKKYGVIGLGIFIGIPLPGSGVYAGTLLAWLLGMKWKRAFMAAVIGVLIAGSIIFAASMGVLSAIGIFF
jgi:uncharacterized membrane protein